MEKRQHVEPGALARTCIYPRNRVFLVFVLGVLWNSTVLQCVYVGCGGVFRWHVRQARREAVRESPSLVRALSAFLSANQAAVLAW